MVEVPVAPDSEAPAFSTPALLFCDEPAPLFSVDESIDVPDDDAPDEEVPTVPLDGAFIVFDSAGVAVLVSVVCAKAIPAHNTKGINAKYCFMICLRRRLKPSP